MVQPLFLQPVFQERIWGGTALKDKFDYDIPTDHTGECWAISAHPNGPSIVKNGEFAGKTLIELWGAQPELFGGYHTKVFPLLTKILDANTDLSVQVHPNDEYANLHENGELGKTECWYIIDCEEGAELIFGHTANTKDEFVQMIENNEWEKLLRKVKIKPGDFFYVPSGTIHALGKGTVVLETQQSSDTTYRLYDYGRVGQDGKLRELHLDQSIDVSTIPHRDAGFSPEVSEIPGGTITKYVEADYFTVYKWEIDGQADFEQNKPFLLASVIEGEGKLTVDQETYSIKRGDHFILPAGAGDFQIEGNVRMITSHV
ncbi:mannose-6-phosphate isomerase, class I [Lederbergia citrea]|uniref:mannose-6-phosphate isomerase, class I n=1 Tax=Lederbergia citrea TaxID=2833581 RepID=UPI001BCA163C|nr:mannose-6-phosphate isomerase, class I [Lederbergia citrea]MBS4178248.1 mannose-6-phosphate isomerase, class I [Lederbergia citrea]MBS4204925.1 mannose-6-phosphate isomerase, class I [Lederbergia citrea]